MLWRRKPFCKLTRLTKISNTEIHSFKIYSYSRRNNKGKSFIIILQHSFSSQSAIHKWAEYFVYKIIFRNSENRNSNKVRKKSIKSDTTTYEQSVTITISMNG